MWNRLKLEYEFVWFDGKVKRQFPLEIKFINPDEKEYRRALIKKHVNIPYQKFDTFSLALHVESCRIYV